jgi:hypothetical protein
MDRSKSGNKGPSAKNPPGSGRGGGGQPGGYLISDSSGPRGRSGRGRGAPNNNTRNPRNSKPTLFAPFPEGWRIAQGPDRSSLVIDKDGTILTTLYPQASGSGSSPSSQFADADDFKVPAAQAKKAKQASARKAREEEHADFSKKEGTHELLTAILNKAKQSSSRQTLGQPSSDPETQEASEPDAVGSHASCQEIQQEPEDTTTPPLTSPRSQLADF